MSDVSFVTAENPNTKAVNDNSEQITRDVNEGRPSTLS